MATYNPDPDKPVTDEQIRLVAHELQGRSWEGVMESSFGVQHNHITAIKREIGGQFKTEEDIISEVLHRWKNKTGIVTGPQMFKHFQKAFKLHNYDDIPIGTLKTLLTGSATRDIPGKI